MGLFWGKGNGQQEEVDRRKKIVVAYNNEPNETKQAEKYLSLAI